MMIFGVHIHVYQVKTMSYARNEAPFCYFLALFPLNEIYRENAVGTITLIPFEIYIIFG